MDTYVFHVILNGPTMTMADVERLYEAGGDDTTPAVIAGQSRIAFAREAASLEAAITSALRTVQAAGLQAKHVELESPSPVPLERVA